ncbi:unnamed protein product [Blepharisma stoltei]|uniref:Sfi1 spindle body domain-containing protein n=1 Tax=Blepharisma stoltei TaxID=1481888 RepID=A0AAU9J3Q2_9CILI|nr:unnamed protein product [Blepharisma stoltei]
MARYRNPKSSSTNEVYSIISTLSKAENLNLAVQCIQNVAQEFQENDQEEPAPSVRKYISYVRRSYAGPENQLDREDSEGYSESSSSYKFSESRPPSRTDGSTFHSESIGYADDSIEYKAMVFSHSITKVMRRRYNHIFKLVVHPLFEKNQINLLRIKSHRTHVHKKFKKIKLTPSEKKNILTESIKRMVMSTKIHLDQDALYRWYFQSVKSHVYVPKFKVLPHSRLTSGVGVLDHIIRCGTLRYHGLMKEFLIKWKANTRIFYDKIDEIQNHKSAMKWLKKLSWASVHFYNTNAYLSVCEGFFRWKQLVLEDEINETKRKYEDYVSSAQNVALFGLSKIMIFKKKSYFDDIKQRSFKLTILRCKLQHLLHLIKKSLRTWLIRMKKPKVSQETNGKSHLQNLAHIVRYNIKTAFFKWKSLHKDDALLSSERFKFRKTILRNLNFILNRDLLRAFETWKSPEYIEEVEEIETVTRNVVTRVDEVIAVKIFTPKQKAFTSLEYMEEHKAEPLKKSHKIIKAALRNLDHILMICVLQAWTKWNQQVSGSFIEFPKQQKIIKFASYQLSYKPLCRIESSLNLDKSFVYSGESFYNSTLDTSSFLKNVNQEECPEGLSQIVSYLFNVKLQKSSLSKVTFFAWQAKSQERNLKRKNLHTLIKIIENYLRKTERKFFEKWVSIA